MNGELRDDSLELVRRTKDLDPGHSTADHRHIIIQHRNHGLLLRCISPEQLDERRREAVCADHYDAFSTRTIILRLVVAAEYDAHKHSGGDDPACQQNAVDERHRARNAIKPRQREHDAADHELRQQHCLSDIECFVHREISRHAVLDPQGEKRQQR